MAGNTNSNNDKDLFEEFEFRPINEGLGFQRRTASTQTITPLTTTNFTTRPTTPMPKSTPSFAAPLPRAEARIETRTETRTEKATRPPTFNMPTVEDDSIAKAQTAVNEILKNLNQKRHMDFLHETEKQKITYKKSKPYFFAATLDAMLITATFLLSMIAMLTITKVDLFMNLGHAETSRFVYAATAGLFLTITFIYMVVNRTFMGFTPGEWAFDQKIGADGQENQMSFVPRLMARTLIVMATGFVLMPMLSYLFNKDLSGQITGVNLFRKPNA